MKRCKQRNPSDLLIPSHRLAKLPGQPFYEKLNEEHAKEGFDDFSRGLCEPYRTKRQGRSSIPAGVYFRMLMVGYFEGLDSEWSIAWRVSDSLVLREFLWYDLDERTPDHSSLSRIRQRLPLEVHEKVFTWVLRMLAKAGLVKGKAVGVDATTLEANGYAQHRTA